MEIQPRWRDVEVTTDLVPRTEVERWQMQDRIRAALEGEPVLAAAPRFFLRGSRIGFRVPWARGGRERLLDLLAAAPWR